MADASKTATEPKVVRRWLEALLELGSDDLRLTGLEDSDGGLVASYALFGGDSPFVIVHSFRRGSTRRVVAQMSHWTVDEAIELDRPLVWD